MARALEFDTVFDSCVLCPRLCNIERRVSVGPCCVGPDLLVAGIRPVYSEERWLCGKGGSGAIFFAGCTHAYVFCQNFQVNRLSDGSALTVGGGGGRHAAVGCARV
jgi:putative pyruvate formate lyase activating enzyme